MDPHPKDKKRKEIVLVAAEESVRSYRELVEDLDRKNPPEISGTKPKTIPEVKQRLIHSCHRYIDYVGSEGEKIVEIRYMMARIYYTYNHFDQAAPAFNDIVANHPTHEVACYAANLALDIYNGEKNYRALKTTSRAYLDNKRLACGEEDRKKFAQIEEQSSFKLIKTELEDKKRYLAAAKAYLQYYKAFPNGEFADDSVYNAAVNYDLAQRLDKANEVRQFLVEKVKGAEPELVRETLLNIAKSYERIVDFANAARYLELYAQRYPKDDNSKDALFNAGLYRATLHEFDGSRRNRQRFIQLYPHDDDARNVAFAICEALETEAGDLERQGKEKKAIYNKWVEAHDCYFNWAKNKSYAAGDTDALCHAQFRRGEIMRTKTNYAKGAVDQKNYLLKNWPKWKRKGLKNLPRCASAMAEIMFREQQGQFKRYKGMTISEINPTQKGKKRFDASVKAKVEARDALIQEYKKVVEFGVPEWGLAALFHIAEAQRGRFLRPFLFHFGQFFNR
jgi:outer membrane protein assembly factor BamD (BamD/ComL family)